MRRSDYAFSPLTFDQYTQIIQAGSMGGTSPMLGQDNYGAFVAACQGINCDPRVLLAGLLFEDHFGCDPNGAAAASVNNLSGIKWAGQSDATDSGVAADTGGTYAKFATLGDFFHEYARTLTNQYIGPAFNAGDLANAWSIYITGQPNSGHGQERVDQWGYYVAKYPPQGGIPMIYGSAVVAVALKHLGETHEYDVWNGDHPVYYMCEADVEDWYTEAGVAVPHYLSAAVAGDAAPLGSGHAPAGAQVFLRGAGWSSLDHTGISLGDGRTISGLASVVISDGWQDLPSYRGWRFPDGVTADPVQDTFFIDGNPYGQVPLRAPFWNRWNKLNTEGLALPMLGYAVAAEQVTASGRRVQQFERGYLGTQAAPDPWDCVALLPKEFPK